MAGTGFNLQTLSIVLVTLTVCIVHVQSSTPRILVTGSCSTPSSCTKTDVELEGILEPCLSDAQGSSTPSPGDSCCKGIISLDPSCLCQALTLALRSTLLSVNTTDALAMPKECGYKVPKNCVCHGHVVPAGILG